MIEDIKQSVQITSEEFVYSIIHGHGNNRNEITTDEGIISFNRVEIIDGVFLDSLIENSIVLEGVTAKSITITEGCKINTLTISNSTLHSISIEGGQIIQLEIRGSKIDQLNIDSGTVNLIHIYQDEWDHKPTSPIPNETIIKEINLSDGHVQIFALDSAMLDRFILDGVQIDNCTFTGAKIGKINVNKKGIKKLRIVGCTINEFFSMVAVVSESMFVKSGFIGYLCLTSEINGDIVLSDLTVCDLNFDYLLNNGTIKLIKVEWPNPINPMLISITNSSLGDFEVIGCDWSNAEFTIENSKLIDMFYTDTMFSDNIVSRHSNRHRMYQQISDSCGQLMAVAERINDKSASLKFRAKSNEQIYEMKKLSMWLWSNTERSYDPRCVQRFIVHIPSFLRFGWYAIWRKEWWEWFQLWMSKISNEFGTSYLRALIVLVTIGAILFGLYLPFTVASESLAHTWKIWKWPSGIFYGLTHHFGDYLGFLNPTRSIGYLCVKNVEGVSDCDSQWALVIDWTSRIIVGYLIYQLIQAFRKFGKG